MPVSLTSGVRGEPRLVLSHPSGSTADVYLHGAHVTSWVPAGAAEVLFLSRAAAFEAGKAIRGGVPVIFPQFADLGPLPKHGFARVQRWGWAGPEDQVGPSVRATLRLNDSEETRAAWPHAFAAELQVDLGEHHLSLALSVVNTGAAPFAFTTALHTYLLLADVRRARVEGLQGARYRERGEARTDRIEAERELRVSGEIDRVYLDAGPVLRVHDEAGRRTLEMRSEGFADVVVWNPWAEGARSLADMEAEEYLRMVCVEPARVAEPVHLPPGARWRGVQRIDLGPASGGASPL